MSASIIKVTINHQSIDLSIKQISWFKRLLSEYEYFNKQMGDCSIELPKMVNDSPFSIDQLKNLVECYKTQIDSNEIDIGRPRSVLEHYLGGILDDPNGSISVILDSILRVDYYHKINVDLTLYQLVSSCKCINYQESESCLTERVVRLGSVDLVKYLFRNLDTSKICVFACKYGYLPILQYAHFRKCYWNEKVCETAAIRGYVDCLRYAIENKCPYGLVHDLAYDAACSCNLDCIKYVYEIGGLLSNCLCTIAAQNGRFDILKYAYENGCPADDQTLDCAVDSGNMDCIQYAVINHFPYGWFSIYSVVKKGNLQLLKYFHTHGCPCAHVCMAAAKEGQLECLIYGCTNKMSLDNACISAIEGNQFECFKYAYEHGAPCSLSEYQKALEYNRVNIIKYLEERGFYL